MTNQDAQNLLNFLSSKDSAFLECTVDANIKIQNNIKILIDYASSLIAIRDNFIQPTEQTKDYDNRKLELLQPYIQTTSDNEIQIIPGNEQKVKELLKDFNDGYKDLLIEINTKKQDWDIFFTQGEADITLEFIKLEDINFPDKIAKGTFQVLYLMIEKD